MNWGYKIMIVYIAFAVGITAMVLKSSSEKMDLVTPDYYAKELKYQDNIDAIKRTQALSSKVSWQFNDNKLVINFPNQFDFKEISGSLLLYCPSDDGKDFKKDFATNNSTIDIALPKTTKGVYKIQLSWVAEGYSYYFEEKIKL
jgi:hypothetical protein